MTYNDLKSEFRLTSDGDIWGTVMQWWLSIADEMYFYRDFQVPQCWEFKPSPLGPSNDTDDYVANCIAEADDISLIRFGNLIHRYASRAKNTGLSY